ncbi:MAG: hypothetical protein CO108_06145 [Deltaproteobacteria bacterium CG_4_9_14_3_um_filter_63_12]|nr:MAG: hypothetical protein CO108_06145 [Deltaproteobacteria bacterium CG_4_9_14_3_um_filter_63_12]
MRVSEDYLLDSLLVTFRSGVRHGPYKEWNSKGKLTREGNFVEGKYEGIWLWYYYNGRIRHRCTFEQGVADATSMKDDFCAHWFDPDPSEDFEPPPLDCPDGTTFQEVGRHRGVFSGAHITSTACVVTDGGESSPEGDVNKSGPIKEGPAADYTRRGVKTYEGRYEKNRPIGRETRWYPSDQLLSEGGWLGEGRRHGEWTFWWENGEIIATCTFEKGALVKFEGDKKTCMDALQKEVPVPIY